MRYKTSCFNPTLAKHDLRRFWPLPVLIFLFLTLIMVPNYYTSMMIYGYTFTMDPYTPQAGVVLADTAEAALRNARESIYGYGSLVVTVSLFAALISALLVMQHIHGRKQIQFYHGLPLSRRCLYTTSTVTGYLMGLLPMVAAELILMIMALCMGSEAFPALQLMGITVSSFTMLYAIAVLSCVLAGQTFGAVLLYAGMNCFVLVLACGGAGVARFLLYGFDEYILLESLSLCLTPVLMLAFCTDPLYTGDGIPYGFPLMPFLIYGLVGLGLLVLSGVLYQHRKAETAGEMISFPFIRGLCRVLVSLMAGLLGTVAMVALMNSLEDVTFPVVLILVLGLMAVGWIAAEMVLRKTFRVFQKKSLLQCLSLMTLMLLILTGAKLDIIGYVNRTPDLSQVTAADVSLYGTPVEITPADALALHQVVLDNQDELSNNTAYYGGYNITFRYYEGEDDVLLRRSYYIPLELDNDIMQSFLTMTSKPEYVYRSWFDDLDTTLTEELIDTAQVYSNGSYDEETDTYTPYFLCGDVELTQSRLSLTTKEAMTLHNAIVRDIQEGKLPSYFRNLVCEIDEGYGYVEYNTFEEAYDAGAETYLEYINNVGFNYHRVKIYPEMTNTLAVLETLGVTVNPEAME